MWLCYTLLALRLFRGLTVVLTKMPQQVELSTTYNVLITGFGVRVILCSVHH